MPLDDGAPQKPMWLTPRELEIISAVVNGHSNTEIAECCKLSEDAVKGHLSSIFDKLGVSTRVKLVLWAIRNIPDKLGGRDDADEAGIAVKKPKNPNLNSGSAAARLDELFG